MSLVLDHTNPSFLSLLRCHYPDLVPRMDILPADVLRLVRSTTIVALTFEGGVIIAADRRATFGGSTIVSEDVVKVFKTDEHSAIAIAGTFGPAVKIQGHI